MVEKSHAIYTMGIVVSLGCCNKVSPVGWLRTAELSLTVLGKVRNQAVSSVGECVPCRSPGFW